MEALLTKANAPPENGNGDNDKDTEKLKKEKEAAEAAARKVKEQTTAPPGRAASTSRPAGNTGYDH